MGIKTRIGIIVVAFLAAMIAGLLFAGYQREEVLRQQLEVTEINGSRALWGKIVETGLQRIRELTPTVTGDQFLRTAIVSGDRGLISEAARRTLISLQRNPSITRLDIVSLSHEVLYSSVPAFEPTAAASEDEIAAMIAAGSGRSGVAIDAERNVTLSVGIPLHDEDGTLLAIAVCASDIGLALRELRNDSGSEVLVVNRRSRLLAGTDPQIWDLVSSSARLRDGASQVLRFDDRVFSLAAFPLEAELGNLVASVVTVRDVSAAFAGQRRVSLITFLSIAGFLLISLLALYLYLRHALSPLTEGVQVLDALSRGDTQATVKIAGERGKDELARIALAVNTFRNQTLALRRHRRRATRRQRQEGRFIRSEMTRLATTLDETEREDILNDLAEIEAPKEDDEGGQAEVQPDMEMAGDLQVMGLAFQKMADRVGVQQERLRKLVAELQEALRTQTAYLALQHDLQVATRVQRSFLPGERLDTEGAHIHAAMQTAREVGGDFYDFFPLDEDRTVIVIGDVVGKGVPASLFMAVTRTVIRATSRYVEDGPGKCLEMVNDTLADASREDVFVTVFYGIFDRRDGTLRYANGGHNPPVLIAPGQAELLPLTGGVALAMFDGLTYDDGEVVIPPDGKLFCYTDGVPESTDLQEEEFGYDRMRENLLANTDRSPSDTIEAMLRRVEDFAGEAEQFDDIAMLVLSRESKQDAMVVHRLSLRNDLAEIPRIAQGIGTFARQSGIGGDHTHDLQTAVADVLTTTIDYRLPAGSTYEIDIRLSFQDAVVEVAVDDDGQPFALVDPPPGHDTNGDGRYISRVGTEIARPAQIDDVDYLVIGGRNRLIMRKRIAA